MPILVSPLSTPAEEITVCNYANPDSNTMQEKELSDVSDIIQAVKNYEKFITDNMQNHAEKMIYYSNFRRQDLEQLLKENTDCGFIRIYHCRQKDESQFTVAVPVEGDNNGTTRQTASVKYYVNCCACKPNCGTNMGF